MFYFKSHNLHFQDTLFQLVIFMTIFAFPQSFLLSILIIEILVESMLWFHILSSLREQRSYMFNTKSENIIRIRFKFLLHMI